MLGRGRLIINRVLLGVNLVNQIELLWLVLLVRAGRNVVRSKEIGLDRVIEQVIKRRVRHDVLLWLAIVAKQLRVKLAAIVLLDKPIEAVVAEIKAGELRKGSLIGHGRVLFTNGSQGINRLEAHGRLGEWLRGCAT